MNEIDKWQEKYNVDYKELESKIQAIKDKTNKQNEATRILKETVSIFIVKKKKK